GEEHIFVRRVGQGPAGAKYFATVYVVAVSGVISPIRRRIGIGHGQACGFIKFAVEYLPSVWDVEVVKLGSRSAPTKRAGRAALICEGVNYRAEIVLQLHACARIAKSEPCGGAGVGHGGVGVRAVLKVGVKAKVGA